MEPEQDAYGHAIRDYYDDGEGFEIIERDDGWIGPSGGPESYFLARDDWPERQQAAMEYVRGRVLDVGCGAGRHALYLQDRGHEVIGIDVSPTAVAVCRDRGMASVRELGIQSVDELEGRFDTILMLGNNLGLVGTRATAGERLDALASVAAPDATLLAESRDPYATDDPAHLAYQERNEERGRLGGALRIRVRYKRYATDWFDYLLASPSELADLVESAPWTIATVIEGDGPGGHYVAVLTTS
jgi:SAM-dependent methyltransferase